MNAKKYRNAGRGKIPGRVDITEEEMLRIDYMLNDRPSP